MILPLGQFVRDFFRVFAAYWVLIGVPVGGHYLWALIAPLMEDKAPHLKSVTPAGLEHEPIQDCTSCD